MNNLNNRLQNNGYNVNGDTNKQLLKRRFTTTNERLNANCMENDNTKKPKLEQFVNGNSRPAGHKRYLMPIHLVTCGLQGSDLGRDETAILQIAFQLIDMDTFETQPPTSMWLRASSLLDHAAEPSKIHISVPAREMVGGATAAAETVDLAEALQCVDELVVAADGAVFVPVTWGHLPLRAVLHREARFRSLTLSPVWTSYYELGRQAALAGLVNETDSKDQLYAALQINPSSAKTSMQILSVMSVALMHLLRSGWEMQERQWILNSYTPSVFHTSDPIDPDVVLLIKPVDYKTPLSQIVPFFAGVNLAPGGVAILMSEGRRSNKILIRLADRQQRDIAMLRDKHHFELGSSRFITMTPYDSREFMRIAGYENDNIMTYLKQIQTNQQILIRMKGLPYSVTKDDILGFFQQRGVHSQFGSEGVHLVERSGSGELNGDAFVVFETATAASAATALKGQTIGSRYVEIFQSTPAEMNQVIAGLSGGCKSVTKKDALVGLTGPDKLGCHDPGYNGGIITNLVPMEASDADYLRFLGDKAHICTRLTRLLMANNPAGHTSYLAELKNPTDSVAVLKYLSERIFRVKATQKEYKVSSFPFTPPPAPLSTSMATIAPMLSPNLLQGPHSGLMTSAFSTGHNPGLTPSNLLGLNSGMLTHLGLLQNHPAYRPLPSILASQPSPANPLMWLLNQQLNGLRAQTAANCQQQQQPQLILTSPPPPPTSYQHLQPAPSIPVSISSSPSSLVYMYGAPQGFSQAHCDSVFQSLRPHISILPKLLQNDQYVYASFNSPEEALMALQRSPTIYFGSQIIQLLPIMD